MVSWSVVSVVTYEYIYMPLGVLYAFRSAALTNSIYCFLNSTSIRIIYDTECWN